MIALDTFVSQRTFRVLLDALAHPGRLLELPEEAWAPGLPAALAVPLALADIGQRVAVVGADVARWAEHLSGATSCALVEPADADEVVVLDHATPALVASLRRGTPLSPERGCRLVLACTSLGPGGPVRLGLRGPGVATSAELGVAGIDAGVFVALAEANLAFPTGVDCFLVARDGALAGLPRSVTMEVG